MYWKESLNRKYMWREFFPAFVVVVNSLTWNAFVLSIFSNEINSLLVSPIEILTFFSVEYIAIAVSAILGSIYFPRLRRISLFVWMISGAIATIMLITIQNNGTPTNLLISSFLGISVGAGLPSSLACFADSTNIENRGFFGGLTYFFVGCSTVFFFVIMIFFSSVATVLAIILWRIMGALLFLLTYKDKKAKQEPNVPPYSHVRSQRGLLLYLGPWVMFCLVNWMEAPLLANLFGELYSRIGFIEVIVSGMVALLGGIIADFAGRKRVIIIGFVILGVDYAVLSLLSMLQVSWYIYAALDSIAWGMFASVFFMTLWGDLAGSYQKEKYYTLGGLPYLLAMFLSELVKPYVEVMPLATAFSLASFFLFLAVVPLMYADETLPEKKIKERELKDYIEKAKKIRGKHP
jgi:MFS family permease